MQSVGTLVFVELQVPISISAWPWTTAFFLLISRSCVHGCTFQVMMTLYLSCLLTHS
jgi:hypothetical protein